MSDKPLLREVMERTGHSQNGLAKDARLPRGDIARAVYKRVDAERAGKIIRVLADATSLTGKERRTLFNELINMPGKSEAMTDRVSTEDPFSNIRGD